MIAKRILTPKGGSGYQRLSGYVLNVSQEHRVTTDPASWTRLGAYILDTGHAGEKVAWARATNCGSDDPGWAVKDILATQAQNTRSKSDKSYHLVVSFPEGERPTRRPDRGHRGPAMRGAGVWRPSAGVRRPPEHRQLAPAHRHQQGASQDADVM